MMQNSNQLAIMVIRGNLFRIHPDGIAAYTGRKWACSAERHMKRRSAVKLRINSQNWS